MIGFDWIVLACSLFTPLRTIFQSNLDWTFLESIFTASHSVKQFTVCQVWLLILYFMEKYAW